MSANTFAPTRALGRIARTRSLDHANSMATATGRSRVPSSDAVEAAQRAPGPGGGGGGSLTSSGIGERDKQADRVRNTLGALLEEAEREIGSSYEATVWRKPEDGTKKAYTGALYKFLRCSRINGFLSPRAQGAHVAGGQGWPIRVAD